VSAVRLSILQLLLSPCDVILSHELLNVNAWLHLHYLKVLEKATFWAIRQWLEPATINLWCSFSIHILRSF